MKAKSKVVGGYPRYHQCHLRPIDKRAIARVREGSGSKRHHFPNSPLEPWPGTNAMSIEYGSPVRLGSPTVDH